MIEIIIEDIMRAIPGDKIKCCTLNGGYDFDSKNAKRYLKKDKIYTVTRVEVGGWSTKVWIEGFDDSFNSVHFEDWDR